MWLTTYAGLIHRLSSRGGRFRVGRRLERLTGGLLVALGIHLAWAKR